MDSQFIYELKKQTKQWHIEQARLRADNGFTHAPNRWQLISVLIYLLVSSQYFVMVLHFENWATRLAFVLTQVFMASLVFLSWLRVSVINPADPVHFQHWSSIVEQKQFKKPEHRLMCPICQTYRSAQSFHCKKCNKCIQKFDHHCKWVNNCIGIKNYLQFLALLALLLIFLAYNSSVILYYLITEVSQQARQAPLRILSIIMCVLNFIGFLLIGFLLSFHIFLICTGRRTIGFIMDIKKGLNEDSIKSDKIQSEKSQDAVNQKFQVRLRPVGVYNADRDENGQTGEQKSKGRGTEGSKIRKISLLKPLENPPSLKLKSPEIVKQ